MKGIVGSQQGVSMGFVKSAHEIAEIIRVMGQQVFEGVEALSVTFASDPVVLRRLLPPPLALTEASVVASTARTRGGCVGPYRGARLLVPCSHDGVPGFYTLASYMDSDAPLIFGKELEGAPKKLARVEFERDDQLARGSVVRHGVEIMTVEASLRQTLEPARGVDHSYNFVASFRADGSGLRGDASLTLCITRYSLSERWSGEGHVRLRSTGHDPLDEVPVGAILGASFTVGDRRNTTKDVATVPAGAFLPFAFARMDDWALYQDGLCSGDRVASDSDR